MTRGGIVIIVEVVVPDQFLARCDVTESEKPHPPFDLIDLAVGVARMIQVRTNPVAIDDSLAVLESVKVGARGSFVAAVGFFGRNAFTEILDDASAFADRRARVNANGMDR